MTLANLYSDSGGVSDSIEQRLADGRAVWAPGFGPSASTPPPGPVSAVPRPEGGSGRPGRVCDRCRADDHSECRSFSGEPCDCAHGQTCSQCGKAGTDRIGISIDAGPSQLPEEYGFCGKACAASWVRATWIEATS